MIARAARTITLVTLFVSLIASEASPQAKPRPRRPPPPPPTLEIGGYAMLGLMNFTAAESFDAILGSASGLIYGGGVRLGLPYGGLFVDVGAWRFRGEGQRVFVFEGQEIALGVPVEIAITPLELTAGWQFRFPRQPRFRAYAGGGWTSYGYQETSEFSTGVENVEDRFNGYRLLGGAEYRTSRWVSVGGEVAWATVPDALGEGGVSAEFDETNLGGTSVRFKIVIGR